MSRTAITRTVVEIVNESLKTGHFPTSYKFAHVCPVPKSGDPTVALNYRPIYLLPVLSKVLERVLHQQVTHFFTNKNPAAIPKQQFAYRSQHSCEDALVLVINWWQRAVDDDKYCGLVLADMSKAFDRVRHRALVATLSSVGIHGMALKWFISYLTNRQQQVTTAEGLSFPSPCTRGVPQGSVLGPLLFSLYIRDAPDVFSTDSQLFADNIAFYTANPSLSHVVSTLNNDLDKLDQYLSRKGLLLNPSKIRSMVLRKPCYQLSEHCRLTCRGITISYCKQAKYLGVTIAEHLTFAPHVKEVCAKAYGWPT